MGAAVSVVASVILDLSVLGFPIFGRDETVSGFEGQWATQPTLPYRMLCVVLLASLFVFDLLPRQAGKARRGQGPPEAASA